MFGRLNRNYKIGFLIYFKLKPNLIGLETQEIFQILYFLGCIAGPFVKIFNFFLYIPPHYTIFYRKSQVFIINAKRKAALYVLLYYLFSDELVPEGHYIVTICRREL